MQKVPFIGEEGKAGAPCKEKSVGKRKELEEDRR